ncbi:MAG: formyltetrahydrofolate deformylase [Ignavibacteria bacterium]|nr:formyltetrahydrofolate deformylase [Ignavibacteria bacterium]
MSDMSKEEGQAQTAILLIDCRDRRGIVVAVTEYIYKNNGNIVYLDQHVDVEHQIFFMRVEWELETFSISRTQIGDSFQKAIAKKFQMQWRLHFSDETPRMAVFVSKLPHCLYDILSRCQSKEWRVDLPLIISNHADLEPIAQKFDVDYEVFPMSEAEKSTQEPKQLELLKEYKIDFVVLARYMQILSEEFVTSYPQQIINIHHSFLPAFPGSKPYHSAYERGVKIIGATSHYVTTELDAGPIIEQDTVRVSHTDTVNDMIRKGRDLEKVVLSRAIWHHLGRKILVYSNRTVVFN